MKSLKNCHILSTEEEKQVLTEYFKNKNPKLANILLLSNYRIIVQTALKFKGYGFPLEELIQEGCLGFSVALKKFDITKNIKLTTYAFHWIKSYIMLYIYKNYSICNCNLGFTNRKLFFQIRKLKKELQEQAPDILLTEEESLNKISDDLKIKKDRVKSIYNFLNNNHPTDITSLQLHSSAPSQEDIVIHKIRLERLHKLIGRTKLSASGKAALQDKLFNANELTYHDLSEQYQLNRYDLDRFIQKAKSKSW